MFGKTKEKIKKEVKWITLQRIGSELSIVNSTNRKLREVRVII